MSFFELVDPHAEAHRGEHAGWLRAAVLGANDGLVSTASLMVGVAASGAAAAGVLTAGIAGIAAGSMAMAAGEYVSVSSQVDVERGAAPPARDRPSGDRPAVTSRTSIPTRATSPARSPARSTPASPGRPARSPSS